MIIYNFYNFGFGNFSPNHNFVRFRTPNNQSIGLIKITSPLPLSIANQFMETTRKERQISKILNRPQGINSQSIAFRTFLAHSPNRISLVSCAKFQFLISKFYFQRTSTVS